MIDVRNTSKPGDVVLVLVANDDGDETLQHAMIHTAFGPNNEAHVQYFEPARESVMDDDDNEFPASCVVILSQDVHSIPLEAVERHWSIDDRTVTRLDETMQRAGLRPIVVKDCDDDVELTHFEVLRDFNDDDFVVHSSSDDDCEPFSLADPASADTAEGRAFVRDMHQSVRDFASWQPSDPQQQRVKQFVEDLAGRAEHDNEDRRMQADLPPIASYINPTT